VESFRSAGFYCFDLEKEKLSYNPFDPSERVSTYGKLLDFLG